METCMFMSKPIFASAAAVAAFTVGACLFSGPAHASVPTDYLVQEVCLDGGGNVTSADPAYCSSKRKLNVGESLPYHKIDHSGNWYSDSFPIADTHGMSKAVQTNFRKSRLNSDPLFPGVV